MIIDLNIERENFEGVHGHRFMLDNRFKDLWFDGTWYDCACTAYNIDLQVYCSGINADFLLWCEAVSTKQKEIDELKAQLKALM